MARRLKGKVVVVTGASSGIGRATALLLARKGADLVLAARRDEPLEEVRSLCEDEGVRAVAVPVDLALREDCEKLAEIAFDEFGRIDAWVNNAGVYAVGAVEDTPPDVFERVMAVNFLGPVWCSRAILPKLREQGSGTIIMVDSLAGRSPGPKLGAYAASKFALRGFSEALRDELRPDGVSVSVVYPPSIDTPIFTHGANFTGKEGQPLSTPYPPEKVARAIYKLVLKPKREVFIGSAGRVSALHTLAPGLVERAMSARTAKSGGDEAPPSRGNLYLPSHGDAKISGGWRRKRMLKRAAALAAIGVAARFAIQRLEA